MYRNGVDTMNYTEKPPLFTINQKINYTNLMKYTYTKECTEADYFSAGAPINGVEYWCPNDEFWGTIIAVHHGAMVACETDFFEMDDIEGCPEEYAAELINGKLI
jgi:hypothetical protein